MTVNSQDILAIISLYTHAFYILRSHLATSSFFDIHIKLNILIFFKPLYDYYYYWVNNITFWYLYACFYTK